MNTAQESAAARAATRRAVQLQRKIIESYSSNYRDCRDIGHVWKQTNFQIDETGLSRILCCDRCTTERHESFTKGGELVMRRYFHADDYLLTTQGGTIKYTKTLWRGLLYQQSQMAN